ncbi:2-oxoglutarate dehydrogenase complex dihydrolipoyllysine-residue succinyltransferase [Parasutterella muris]|uniref:Dihydrolipoyllysine-residue succinyltransferase component of 2-oxoglutarate dehydrogenase complex n=3 Tax=Parasutterella TaxID=577310 RepID=A0A6L6YEF0_9BURK|nr:2-oxoglutarate dehydrogenase complex dihydrolipoyllysine-residue succinyltransferase [Parasutterella muris]MVX55867.1 2-oxoglutarate dehydrogenase complex dihydrolipoyllysine-residue succinyltransferase [Parasutterella muris]
MSIVEVKVPELSESVSEASLIEWKKKVGEPVKADEILIEIETDKIVLEIPSPADGVLSSIERPNGASVLSDQLIATVDTEAVASAPKEEAPKAEEAAPVRPAAQTAAAPKAPTVMPAAEKLMANSGIDAAAVAGTGLGGRITKQDVLSMLKTPAPAAKPEVKPAAKPAAAPRAELSPALGDRPEQRVPMSRLRVRVAERLVQSQSDCAILTTFNEVNMAPVMALRAKYKESFEKKYGIKLGFMSFFVKAAVHALKQFPIINASIEGSDIIYHGYIDIGIAVGSPRGLVVPVLRDADQKSFAQIEREIADFAARAKSGKLTLEELTGGTFTISNGGVYGSLFSTPIINPPQSAILGVHGTKPRPVAENGEVVIRPMNYLAMSYDHRLIDGKEAVLALVAMCDALEDPARLLLDL